MRLFFSRRIGLSDIGGEVPILAGTRLTGRQGAYSIGALNIQQRSTVTVPAANFTVLRVRRDLFANSDIGAVFMNKEEEGPAFNRVVGVDANFRFGPLVSLNAYGANTFSPADAVPPEGRTYTMRAGGRYDGRAWQFNGRYDAIGARFNDELGFVPRVGVDNAFLFAGRRFSRWRSHAGFVRPGRTGRSTRSCVRTAADWSRATRTSTCPLPSRTVRTWRWA
jgi:hypothetical protein